jgi:hypothetical protein
MKKALVVLALAALLVPALASADSWTGWITDDQCGAKGAKAEHASCAKKCLEQGSKLVFFNSADQKLYNLDNQKLAEEHLGHEVVVTGSADGNSIKVESISMPKAE